MPCKICSKSIKKHDEADMIICLSKYFGHEELMTVNEIVAAVAEAGLLHGWGQPFVETSSTWMIQEKESSLPVTLVRPELIVHLAFMVLEEGKVVQTAPLEQLVADLAKPIPEEAPKDAIGEDSPEPTS